MNNLSPVTLSEAKGPKLARRGELIAGNAIFWTCAQAPPDELLRDLLGDTGYLAYCHCGAMTEAPLLHAGARLTDYARNLRYPEEGPDPTPAEIQEALTLSRSICEAILTELPPEVRPDGAS